MHVRHAQIHDLDTLTDLLEGAEHWLAVQHLPHLPLGFHREHEADLAASITNGSVFVAEYEGKIAATGTLKWFDADDVWDSDPFAAYLSRLAIDQRFNGQGIGSDLLQWLERHALEHGKNRMRLNCWHENTRLCAYYENRDYVSRGLVQQYGITMKLYEKTLSTHDWLN